MILKSYDACYDILVHPKTYTTIETGDSLQANWRIDASFAT